MGNRLLLTLIITLSTSLSFAQQSVFPTGGMIGNFPTIKPKYPQPVDVNYCREQEKRCAGQKMEETSICLIGPRTMERASDKLSVYRWCGFSSDKFPIQSPEDLRKAFNSLSQKCVKIKDLKIFAHGAPGVAEVIGDSILDLRTTREQFANYSCLMSADANVELNSCNTGRGCRGEDFMANFAQTMLPKGGTFTANTHYLLSGGFLAVLSPTVINLTKRQVTYKPNSWPRFEWNYLGQVSGIKDYYKQDTKTCVDELQAAIKQFKDISKDAEDQKCAARYASPLKNAEALMLKLSKPQITDARNSKKYLRQDAPQYSDVLSSLEVSARFLYQGHCDIREEEPSEPRWKNGVQ